MELISAFKITTPDTPFLTLGKETIDALRNLQTYSKDKSHQNSNLRQKQLI